MLYSKARPGGRANRLPGRDQRVELGRRHAEHAIAPGIVGHEARVWRQQVAQGDRRAVACGGGTDANCGTYSRERRIEREPALVAQRQDRERRHVLGHRGDAEGGVGPDLARALDVGEAERRHMGEAAVLHDPGDEARDLLLLGEGREGRVDLGEGSGHAPA